MKTIPLTQGKEALVDDEDYERLSQYKWCYTALGYARRQDYSTGRQITVLLHRQVMGLEHGDPRQVDHINRDRLDNRKANLRLASQRVNTHNRPGWTGRTSRYKGVCWNGTKWQAGIKVNGKSYHLGMFDSEWEAAEAYNAAAVHHHGGHAFQNERVS